MIICKKSREGVVRSLASEPSSEDSHVSFGYFASFLTSVSLLLCETRVIIRKNLDVTAGTCSAGYILERQSNSR